MDYHSSGPNTTPAQSKNQMSHSVSSPSNMDNPAEEGVPQSQNVLEVKKTPSKMFSVQVHFLDGTIGNVQIQYKALGNLLFEQVCKMLNLLEVDYFGLEYSDEAGVKYWLDYDKPMCRQLGLSMVHPVMYFSIKFYTPDPAQLEEEYTRYLFSLQIKRDLAQGLLQCNENTAALMASYIVQSECGDYNLEDYPDHLYLSSYKFVPNQDTDFQRKIMENHKKHVGQTPSEADLNLLETSRRCELYGIRMTPAKDNEGVPLNLATAHMGVLVFQNYTKINTFSWAKIRKLSFKRKRFLIKLHPEGYGFYKDSVDFNFESRNECKNFWKKCIENHAFFRCAEVKKVPRQKTRIFSRGSSFRYSGRTQKQIVEFVRENYIKRQPFQRSTSLRIPSSSRSGVGTSISAQPLLPVSGSQSCGSVIISSENASSNRPSSPSHSPPRPPLHQNANSVSQPVSPTHHHMTNGGSAISNERDPSRTSPDGNGGQSRGGHKSDREDDSLPPVIDSPVQLRFDSRNYSSLSGHGANELSAAQSETTSLSARGGGLSSDSEAPPKSPSSPYRSWREGSSTPVSPRSDMEADSRRRKIPSEKAYFIAKELLMTERSYKKDLELLNVWFRDEVSKEENMPTEPLSLLFHLVDPLYEHHCNFLRALEQRVAAWEGRVSSPSQPVIHGIGDVILEHCGMTKHYDHYIDKLPLVLERLNNAYKYSVHFNQVYRDFEMQKVCYLPLMAFLLRPCHRLQHYCFILERFVTYHNAAHPDWNNCKIALLKLQGVTNTLKTSISSLENYVKLMELQRDLMGLDNLIIPGREFLREGCLQKLSRKGYQQRMFFLFSDVLLYTSRASTPQLQFKVHGQLPLQGVMVEATEPKMGVNYCFTIYGGNRALMVASNSEHERIKWLDDLSEAVNSARDPKDDRFMYSSLQSCSSSDELLDKIESPQSPYKEGLSPSSGGLTPSGVQEKHLQHRSNTTVHVCWHRNASVSRRDYQMAMLNYLSGYLLRKFKNSSGWQKLWVVFTNFCLFFYKSYQDDFPLASLPLLGYTVSSPMEQDNISKDFVFKLQFKNHVYFFRAESEYTFSRWVEVISSATLHHRT